MQDVGKSSSRNLRWVMNPPTPSGVIRRVRCDLYSLVLQDRFQENGCSASAFAGKVHPSCHWNPYCLSQLSLRPYYHVPVVIESPVTTSQLSLKAPLPCPSCHFWGTKKPLRACYCSGMLFLRYKKAPAGMLLLRSSIFEVRKSPCGHVNAQKCYFWGTKKPRRACYCS